MEHLLAVGSITDAAKAIIEQSEGRIWYVSDTPSVILVQLPGVRFEHEHYEHYVIRIKLENGSSLIWQGDCNGPEITSVERTRLYDEDNEPKEEAAATVALDNLDLGDLDEHPF